MRVVDASTYLKYVWKCTPPRSLSSYSRSQGAQVFVGVAGSHVVVDRVWIVPL